jgi:hypothetical protein
VKPIQYTLTATPTWVYTGDNFPHKTQYKNYSTIYHTSNYCSSFENTVTCSLGDFSYNTRSVNEDGITVKGTPVEQQFSSVYVGALEDEIHSIVLHIKRKVLMTTKDKKQCETCGFKNDYDFRYCAKCGTYL